MSQTIEKSPEQQSSRFLRVLALLVSYLFHPIFMPAVMTVVLYKLAPVSFASFTGKRINFWFATIALNSILYPLLVVLMLRALGFLKSLHMPDNKDRIIPLIATMIFYFWNNMLAANNGSPLVMHVFTLGCFWGIVVLFIINIFFKISMHAMAAGGMLGILLVLTVLTTVNMKIPLFAGLIIAGLIGTARLVLKAHRNSEIWLGYVLGILVQLAAYVYLK